MEVSVLTVRFVCLKITVVLRFEIYQMSIAPSMSEFMNFHNLNSNFVKNGKKLTLIQQCRLINERIQITIITSTTTTTTEYFHQQVNHSRSLALSLVYPTKNCLSNKDKVEPNKNVKVNFEIASIHKRK
jgi:hypothetical protein